MVLRGTSPCDLGLNTQVTLRLSRPGHWWPQGLRTIARARIRPMHGCYEIAAENASAESFSTAVHSGPKASAAGIMTGQRMRGLAVRISHHGKTVREHEGLGTGKQGSPQTARATDISRGWRDLRTLCVNLEAPVGREMADSGTDKRKVGVGSVDSDAEFEPLSEVSVSVLLSLICWCLPCKRKWLENINGGWYPTAVSTKTAGATEDNVIIVVAKILQGQNVFDGGHTTPFGTGWLERTLISTLTHWLGVWKRRSFSYWAASVMLTV